MDTACRLSAPASEVLPPDGVHYRIRPLSPADRERLLQCFSALSPESRRRRFFGVKAALTETDLAFLTGADGRDHIALGALRLDATGAERAMLGTARCIRLGSGSDLGELAITVVDQAQGQGIGRALAAELLALSVAQGIRQMRFEVLASNHGMRALAERLGARVHSADDATLEYRCDLLPPEAPLAADSTPLDPFGLARLGALAWAALMERASIAVLRTSAGLLRLWLVQWSPDWVPPETARVTDQTLVSGTRAPMALR